MKTQRLVQISTQDLQFLKLYYTQPSSSDDDFTLRIKDFLRSLSPRDLSVFLLYLEHYSLRSIAAYLSISHSTVQRSLNRTLFNLRSLE